MIDFLPELFNLFEYQLDNLVGPTLVMLIIIDEYLFELAFNIFKDVFRMVSLDDLIVFGIQVEDRGIYNNLLVKINQERVELFFEFDVIEHFFSESLLNVVEDELYDELRESELFH